MFWCVLHKESKKRCHTRELRERPRENCLEKKKTTKRELCNKEKRAKCCHL